MAHMPQNVSKRIVKACQGGKPIVVVPRHKLPSRVFKLEKYLKMQEVPRKGKPWLARQKQKRSDPLGAVEGRVLKPIRRKTIYDSA